MRTKIACVSCGEFFEPELSDVQEFIADRADGGFLKRILLAIKRCSSIPPKYRKQIETQKEYLVFLLMTYCPYCREVKFGRATCPELPREKLSEEKYLQEFRKEINRNGGFQIKLIPKDYIALVDDEN